LWSFVNELTLSTNHCSIRLALSLAESKQNMAKIAFCPAYLDADHALITLAIISFTMSICLGGDGSRHITSNDASNTDGGDTGGER
jgi:hypothetical protein